MTDSWGNSATEPEMNGGGDANMTEANGATTDHKNMDKTEYEKKARDAGWTETTAFDYGEFQRTGGNDADWRGAAKKYEWNDEYGDVGPEIKELEDILFGGEFQVRKGDHAQNLDLDVKIEGPEKIAPVFKVSN